MEELMQTIEKHLAQLDYSHDPDGLYEPVRYVLSLGGKRIRPALFMMAYEMYSDKTAAVLDVAAGIEIFHNFTLLHDDVMDNADIRRGMPTVHRKWNENTAILSGDCMLVLAYRYLTRVPSVYLPKVLEIIDRAFTGIMEGQQMDMDFESRDDVTVPEYMRMIELKTSVLLAAALELGAVLGDSSEDDQHNLYDFGLNMGLAFQLQDDLLDVYGNPDVFGKNIGGDILCNKKTFMYISARRLADRSLSEELEHWAVWKGEPEQKIKGVTAVYDRLGIRELCRQTIDGLFNASLDALAKVSVSDAGKVGLHRLVSGLMNRRM